ncbi:hypothetical protein YC2023_038310 [Brassica napus]
MEYEPPRDWWGVWENAAAVAFKNDRLRIEAPVRLSHAESWREGAVIHCKGYRLHPREPDAECTRAGGSTGMQQEKGRVGLLELCRTISGNDNDMCVLNPAPRNPGWKWGRGGCFNWYQSQTVIANAKGKFEQLRVFGQDQVNKKSPGISRLARQVKGEWKVGPTSGRKRPAGDTAPHWTGKGLTRSSKTSAQRDQLPSMTG